MASFDDLSEPSRTALGLAIRHYADQVRADRRVSLPALFLPGIGSIFTFYVPPLLIAAVLRRFGRGADPTMADLVPYVVLFGVSWLVGELIWRVGIHFLIRAEMRGMQRLYTNGMDHLFGKDLAFFHDNFTGSLTKRLINYARNYEGVLDQLSFQVIQSLVPLVFVGVVLWRYSPWLVFTLVAGVLITLACVVPLIRRRQAMVEAREVASARLAGHISDVISNIEAVRAFAREPDEAAIHAANTDRWARRTQRSYDYQNQRIDMVTGPLYVLTNVAGLLVALAVGGGGLLTLEIVFVTFSYYAGFTRVMWEFNQIYRHLESWLTEAAQFTELLLEPPKITDPPNPAPFAPSRSDVEFRDVSFKYHEAGDEPLFDGFSLRIASGEKVGLVGRSGGGKTTVTRLLLRFRDVDAGEILIGGQNIAAVTQADLRSMISYVPQDPVMFHRSVKENIRFGRLDVTEDDVVEAARLAHAVEFIERLPNGYDTLIGERGVKLSGGQRQRVAIARAMLRGAPILLLDEATSSLDSESEQLIQDALWNLMEGRTTIVIAHRLSTVQRMDRLIVLEGGAIAEEGTHRELLEAGGTYATLWAHQVGGFLADESLDLTPTA